MSNHVLCGGTGVGGNTARLRQPKMRQLLLQLLSWAAYAACRLPIHAHHWFSGVQQAEQLGLLYTAAMINTDTKPQQCIDTLHVPAQKQPSWPKHQTARALSPFVSPAAVVTYWHPAFAQQQKCNTLRHEMHTCMYAHPRALHPALSPNTS